MPGWIVRQGQPQDTAVVVEFNRALAWETEGRALDPARLSPGVAAVLNDPGKGLYWLADADGEVVGQLMVTPEWSDWRNGWFWWFQSVYVKPAWRRRGVFRSLAKAVESAAMARPDVCGLRLYMEPHNDRARATYSRMGWAPAGYELFERDFTGMAAAPCHESHASPSATDSSP
jgi:GNAT superfamily N-acetyltransferase